MRLAQRAEVELLLTMYKLNVFWKHLNMGKRPWVADGQTVFAALGT